MYISLIKYISGKPRTNLLFVASNVKGLATGPINIYQKNACENCGKLSHKHPCRDTSNCVNCQENHKSSSSTCPNFITLSKLLPSLINITKIPQLNITSSHTWRKFNFIENKLGFGVATLIKDDIKSVFVNNIKSNIKAIWNLVKLNGKCVYSTK